MMADLGTKGKEKVDIYYVNTGMPFVVEENFEGYYHDHGAYLLGDVLQCQETVYQSLQGTRENDEMKASLSNHHKSDHKHSQASSSNSVEGTSESRNIISQLAADEALARELQYAEDNLSATSLSETARPASVIQEPSPSPASGVNATSDIGFVASAQDDIDPDSMTYEQLQSLGEAVGTESRGLSDELISFLQTSSYKTGFFSRKDKHEECVICCMPYKNREVLITLPCKHSYHSECVKRWLKINKACPVCNEEVFGS